MARRRPWAWAVAAVVGVLVVVAAARLLARGESEIDGSSAAEPVERAPVERLRVRVVERYPHQRDAFTQGLVWNEGALYESTGVEGHSSLRLVELLSLIHI